jgi:hypothetical protein
VERPGAVTRHPGRQPIGEDLTVPSVALSHLAWLFVTTVMWIYRLCFRLVLWVAVATVRNGTMALRNALMRRRL